MLATFFATFCCFGRNRNFRNFLHFHKLLRSFSATVCREAHWRRPLKCLWCSASTRSAETLHRIIRTSVLLMWQHWACRYVMNAVQRFNKNGPGFIPSLFIFLNMFHAVNIMHSYVLQSTIDFTQVCSCAAPVFSIIKFRSFIGCFWHHYIQELAHFELRY